LSALEMLRISLFGPPNRRKQPERYAKWGKIVGLKIFKRKYEKAYTNFLKNILDMMVKIYI
jgi:hypothetical protein